jgi:hypothetical protein
MAERDSLQLEDRLRGLGNRIDFPAEPDIAAHVRARIEASTEPVRGVRRSFRLQIAVAALAIALLAGGVLVFSPTTRNAVADWIGLDGLKIEYGERPEAVLGNDLLLGRPVTLEEATAAAGFDLRPPATLGSPDEVFFAPRPVERISLVYEASEVLPRTGTTRVGLLLTAFRAQIERDMLLKKAMGSNTRLERVDVNGSPGYWISGDLHVLIYVDEHGRFAEDRARLAGNTLAWQKGDVVFRLESSLSKARALEIARSVP